MRLSIIVRNVTADPRPFGIYGYKPNPNRVQRIGGYRIWDLMAAPSERVTGIESDRAIDPGETVSLSREVGDAAYGLEWYVRPEAHQCFEVKSFKLGDESLLLREPEDGQHLLLGAPPVD